MPKASVTRGVRGQGEVQVDCGALQGRRVAPKGGRQRMRESPEAVSKAGKKPNGSGQGELRRWFKRRGAKGQNARTRKRRWASAVELTDI